MVAKNELFLEVESLRKPKIHPRRTSEMDGEHVFGQSAFLPEGGLAGVALEFGPVDSHVVVELGLVGEIRITVLAREVLFGHRVGRRGCGKHAARRHRHHRFLLGQEAFEETEPRADPRPGPPEVGLQGVLGEFLLLGEREGALGALEDGSVGGALVTYQVVLEDELGVAGLARETGFGAVPAEGHGLMNSFAQ